MFIQSDYPEWDHKQGECIRSAKRDCCTNPLYKDGIHGTIQTCAGIEEASQTSLGQSAVFIQIKSKTNNGVQQKAASVFRFKPKVSVDSIIRQKTNGFGSVSSVCVAGEFWPWQFLNLSYITPVHVLLLTPQMISERQVLQCKSVYSLHCFCYYMKFVWYKKCSRNQCSHISVNNYLTLNYHWTLALYLVLLDLLC